MSLSLLTIAFVVLKLMHYIDWSWWLVCLPTILQVVLPIVIMLLGVLIALVSSVVATMVNK